MAEYGLIGEHLGHSFSKVIHEKLADYSYELMELTPQQLTEFMTLKNFKAINVTIPYKQKVIPFLDYIDDNAKRIGAVNTIVNRDGRLYGYNTDYDGIVGLIKKQHVTVKNRKVLILGSGGTCKTASFVFKDLGAKEILVASRKPNENQLSYDEAMQVSDINIIFNATPCGMYPNIEDCPIDISGFKQLEAVLDAIYNPIRTNLVLAAQSLNINAAGGLYMLVKQAVVACSHFTGRHFEKHVTDNVYEAILHAKENIVLIGMPGCGKSTVAKILNCKTKRPVIEMDSILKENFGCSIAEVFAQKGEAYFRSSESQLCKELSALNGHIISTGGGVIVKKENIMALKRNGFVIFIDRDLEKLQFGNGRPLTADFEAMKKKYEERYDLYCTYCDSRVKNNGSLTRVANIIGGKFL